MLVKLKQRTRMHANHAVNDELQARKTHTLVRQASKVKGTVRVTNVHHNLQRQIRHGRNLRTMHREVQHIAVNIAGIAFGTGNRDFLTVTQMFRRIAAAHHCWNTQLTRDNGRVTGTSASVGNNGRCFLHDWFPIRIGHIRHQHITRLNAVHFTDVMDNLYRPCADSMTDGTAFGQHFAVARQLVALHHLFIGTNGFWARLNDKQLTGVPIFRPLDIHWATIVLLNHQRLMCQLLHFMIVQTKAIACVIFNIFNTNLFAVLLAFGIHHSDFLRTHGATHNRRFTLLQRRFVNVKLIRVYRTLHHHFAQTVG